MNELQKVENYLKQVDFFQFQLLRAINLNVDH